MKEINLYCAKECSDIPYLGSDVSVGVLQSIMAQHIAQYGSHSQEDFAWEWGREVTQEEQFNEVRRTS